MDQVELKNRTKTFALRIIRVVEALPTGRLCEILGRQILRAGTSVGANYRAACRARSNPDFLSKMGIVEEELDECLYWMELLADAKIMEVSRLKNLEKEANELLSITVSSIKTARSNSRSRSIKGQKK
ncbi:four helix bundle protein [bacterium]|nr:four helix bundle protein [bacterium]